MHRLHLLWLLLFAIGCDGTITLPVPGLSEPAASTSDGQSGHIQVYFTKPEGSPSDPNNPAQALAGYITQAQKTIDVCAFELDNHVITDALVSATRRGVKVRLVTDTDYLKESGVASLRAARVPIVDDQRNGLMHNKFMVFDNERVWTGSMNFTENCAYKNNNHGIFIDDPRVAANYATKFRWMFEERKFGGLPNRSAKIPNPVVQLGDGTMIENYFSTHDRVAYRVGEKIEQARKSIHFLAFSFTHDDIGRTMLRRGGAGVQVQGVFERIGTSGGFSEYQALRLAGPPVQVYLDANAYRMHHKVIILDNSVTIAGSFNFSNNADEQNDENLVIIHNPDVAKRFESEFQYVYGAAKRAEETRANTISMR